MATFPNLCEVSYDQGGVLELEELVPYRYRNVSSSPSAKFRGSSAAPRADLSTSLSVYDYEPYTVGCRTPVTPRTFSPYRPNTGISSCYSSYYPVPSRAHTLPPNSYTYEASLADTLCPPRRSQERAHTAPLPNLPTTRKAMSILSQEQMKEDDVNLKWIPALNTWVAEKKIQYAAPFVSFVNSLQLLEKEQQYEYENVDVEALPTLPCGRFLAHMHVHKAVNRALREKKQFQIKKRHKIKGDRDSAIAILKEAKKKKASAPPMVPSKSPTKVRFVKSPSPVSSRAATPPPPKPKPVSPLPSPKIPTPIPTPPPEVQPEEPQPIEEPEDEPLVENERTITPVVPSEPPEPSPVPSPAPTPQPPTPVPPVVIEVTLPPPPTPSPPPRTPDPPPRESTPLPPTSPDPPPREPTPAPPTPPPPPPPPREPTPVPPKPPSPKPPSPNLAISQNTTPPTVEPVASSAVAATPPRQKTPTSPAPSKDEEQTHLLNPKTKSKKNKPSKGKGSKNTEPPKEITKPPVLSAEVHPADGPDLKPTSLVSETRSSKKSQSPVQSWVTGDTCEAPDVGSGGDCSDSASSSSDNTKRTRWRAKHQTKKTDSPLPDTPSPDAYPMPEFSFHRVGDWIYGDEDFSVPLPDDFHKDRDNEEDSSMDAIPSPTTPLTPSSVRVPIPQPPKELKKMPPSPRKKRWGQKQIDSSYADELRRQLQAEERKQKQQEMLEKLRQKKNTTDTTGRSQSPKFEDYGWLAKYCILNKGTVDMYRNAFDVVDEGAKGWLTITESLIGMRAINQRLSRSEEHYIQRILEVTGYKLNDGADFKLFCVLASLSQRVASLDEWLKQMISNMDYQMLDLRIFMARTLWECNVDPDTQTISMDQMCVELRAGGVSPEHEAEVRDKLGHICALDLLDFLTYIPLFLMVHNSVVTNPLDDTRNK